MSAYSLPADILREIFMYTSNNLSSISRTCKQWNKATHSIQTRLIMQWARGRIPIIRIRKLELNNYARIYISKGKQVFIDGPDDISELTCVWTFISADHLYLYKCIAITPTRVEKRYSNFSSFTNLLSDGMTNDEIEKILEC